MLLPANFTTTIADTFYDKEVEILEKTTTSTDGWVTETGTTSSTFKANVRFENLGEVQTDMGLTEQVDVLITCAADTTVEVGTLLKYADTTYRADAVIPNDSHKRIAGSKWQ